MLKSIFILATNMEYDLVRRDRPVHVRPGAREKAAMRNQADVELPDYAPFLLISPFTQLNL